MRRVSYSVLWTAILGLTALSCCSDGVNDSNGDDVVNTPWVQVCVSEGRCGSALLGSLGCRSSFDTTAWDDLIEVFEADTLCLEVTFAPGDHADSVTHVQYVVDDPTAPTTWLDAGDPANHVYPPGSPFYVAEAGTVTLWVWVKDDYGAEGSMATTCVRVSGISNRPPDTAVAFGPMEGCRLSVMWIGFDPDGLVEAYEIGICDGPLSSVACPSGPAQWTRTASCESVFALPADSSCSGEMACHTYTLFVRAVDNEGAHDPTPATLSRTATTHLPQSLIVEPELGPGQTSVTSGPVITVRCVGEDFDGQVAEYRFGLKFDLDHPAHQPPYQYDLARWSPWSAEPEITLNLGETDPENPYSLYVQCRDDCHAAEMDFEAGRNHILIHVE